MGLRVGVIIGEYKLVGFQSIKGKPYNLKIVVKDFKNKLHYKQLDKSDTNNFHKLSWTEKKQLVKKYF